MVERLKYVMPDVIAISQMEKICFGKEAWSLNNIRAEFCHDFSYFFAERREGVIVGYVCVRLMYEEAQVCNLAVLPEYRRQGIGTALVSHVLEFSKQQGCERCELEVNVCNEGALALYEKCGFERAGIRKNFYRKSRYDSRDAYTLVKQL